VGGRGEGGGALLCGLARGGQRGVRLPASDVPVTKLGAAIPAWAVRREPPRLPEVSEPEVIRHFTRLSVLNFHLDQGLYPLGSCTMKHNPKINDEMAALPGFGELHPLAPEEAAQGALALTRAVSDLL